MSAEYVACPGAKPWKRPAVTPAIILPRARVEEERETALADVKGRVERALHEIASSIESWAASDHNPWVRTTVADSAAGDLVIAQCRARGYAADYHWHGEPGSYHIQVSRNESGLSFPHGRTGAWRPTPAKGSAR